MKVLEDENASLRRRLDSVELELARSEQYRRLNSLRVSDIPEKSEEKTDALVMALSKSVGANFSLDDVDRPHRVGKPSGPSYKPPDILIKFESIVPDKNCTANVVSSNQMVAT